MDVNFQAARLRQGRRSAAAGTSATPCSSASWPAAAPRRAPTRCYVIDSPQQLFNCKVDVPYQNRVEAQRLVHAALRHPGGGRRPEQSRARTTRANRTYTLAEIQPSLGRPLSGGLTHGHHPARDAAVDLRPAHQSVRSARHARSSGSDELRLQANVDAYNLFNSNTPVTLFGTYNARWGQPTQVLDGRLVKFSVQIDF